MKIYSYSVEPRLSRPDSYHQQSKKGSHDGDYFIIAQNEPEARGLLASKTDKETAEGAHYYGSSNVTFVSRVFHTSDGNAMIAL